MRGALGFGDRDITLPWRGRGDAPQARRGGVALAAARGTTPSLAAAVGDFFRRLPAPPPHPGTLRVPTLPLQGRVGALRSAPSSAPLPPATEGHAR